ncbi:MAG: N-acetylmuramoyl-L-alanine amidase, partial [Firmicutes bacterium]|nr:N-acetylmuramoyl-L-alanine amidase [Bacillota bacterium]
ASRPVSSLPAKEGPLAGHVIAVDAGHGGYDGGARAPNGRWEKVYNLDIATRLAEYLSSLGGKVVLTRDSDYALCDPNPKMRKKRQDMERRADLVLVGGAEILVSIHMNEYRNKNQSGPQVFYRAGCPAGKLLAETLQAQMIESLSPRQRREAHVGDFYILSLGIPSALVECGFLSNTAEEALLRTDTYAQRVAEAVGDGIVNWFELTERPAAAERENR